MRRAAAMFMIGSLLAASGVARARTPDAPVPAAVTVTLTSGDVLRGTVEGSLEADPLVLAHPLFGRMTVARTLIQSVQVAQAVPLPVEPSPPAPAPVTPPEPPASPDPPAAGSAEAPSPPAPDAPPAAAAEPPPPPPPQAPPSTPPPPPAAPAPPAIGLFDNWTGTFEAGFNALSGSTDRLSGRAGLGFRRQTPETITTTNFLYVYGRDNRGLSEDRARLDLRNDWLQGPGSGWRIFGAFTGEYDSFQSWDWRLSGQAGVGYDLIKEADFTLIGRAGLGASRELGRVDNTVRPEVTPGLDLEYRIDERSKVVAGFDYYRDLDKFEIYRFVARAAYEILLDKKSNLVLRIGVEDRYDDAAGYPAENNNVEFFTTLVFRF